MGAYLMENKQLLELEVRRKIYNHIIKKPGLHLRKLVKVLKIPKLTLWYYVTYLKRNELINKFKRNFFIHLFQIFIINNFFVIIIFCMKYLYNIIVLATLYFYNSWEGKENEKKKNRMLLI